jgi:hypothetical protein
MDRQIGKEGGRKQPVLHQIHPEIRQSAVEIEEGSDRQQWQAKGERRQGGMADPAMEIAIARKAQQQDPGKLNPDEEVTAQRQGRSEEAAFDPGQYNSRGHAEGADQPGEQPVFAYTGIDPGQDE